MKRKILHICFIVSMIGLLTSCGGPSPEKTPEGVGSSAAEGPPNFLLIMADDLGYGDVSLGLPDTGVFNNPYIKTPNLAELASESLVLTHHYSASTVCSPARAGLLTGRTPTRSNINRWINDLDENREYFLHGDEITVAELLRDAGYETAIFGKWHLNGMDWEVPENWTGASGSFPKQQGFDHGFAGKEDPHVTR
jgi:arylsulfatase A